MLHDLRGQLGFRKGTGSHIPCPDDTVPPGTVETLLVRVILQRIHPVVMALQIIRVISDQNSQLELNNKIIVHNKQSLL